MQRPDGLLNHPAFSGPISGFPGSGGKFDPAERRSSPFPIRGLPAADRALLRAQVRLPHRLVSRATVLPTI